MIMSHKPEKKKSYWWIIIGTLSSLHFLILLYNFNHVPRTYGYDWPGHFTYLFHVAEHWQVPTADITPQFFNPPLYYFSVAAFSRITTISLVTAGLVFNIFLAALTLIFLIDIARRTLKQKLISTALFLGLYISVPVVYRAYGMMRPEAMLIMLFTAAAWATIYITQNGRPPRYSAAIITAALAGLAVGVRQWGVFLEAALFLWLIIIYIQTAKEDVNWRSLFLMMGVHTSVFLTLFTFFYVGIRDSSVTGFNVDAQQFNPIFLTRLELQTLFSTPIRPALNYRFWPTLYADFWGDYWRYWRESTGEDYTIISSAVQEMLVYAMWAGVLFTGLTMAALIRLRPKKKPASMKRVSITAVNGLDTLSWLLLTITISGFLIFTSRYAIPGKGDTVKSIYIVYLVPFIAWMVSRFIQNTKHQTAKYTVATVAGLSLLLLLPNTFYLPAPHMFGRVWEEPVTQHSMKNRLGGAYSLLGYTIDDQQVTLIWRADQYTGKPYKVFVQLIDADGQIVAQSDTVPSNWGRATTSWMLDEYITDSHTLTDAPKISDDYALLVGMYHEHTGQRLLTDDGRDSILLTPSP